NTLFTLGGYLTRHYPLLFHSFSTVVAVAHYLEVSFIRHANAATISGSPWLIILLVVPDANRAHSTSGREAGHGYQIPINGQD
ncbi:MAG: hypothetical protein ACRD3S_13700, partial [Terracidiphilus sp.]